jgi:hypothetical protein
MKKLRGALQSMTKAKLPNSNLGNGSFIALGIGFRSLASKRQINRECGVFDDNELERLPLS